MEMSQGNSLYLKQTKMSFSSFTKAENRRAEQFLSGGVGSSGRREDVWKRCRRVNMLQILCIHVYKWKNETC
jgi:hypothetical protein